MKFLLDTHAMLWWWDEEWNLSAPARRAIESGKIYISAAAIWEMATKYRLGKLPQAGHVLSELWQLLDRDSFARLSVSLEHGLRAAEYRASHADPFDRMLAAQAELDDLVLVTKDKAFADFPCATRW